MLVLARMVMVGLIMLISVAIDGFGLEYARDEGVCRLSWRAFTWFDGIQASARVVMYPNDPVVSYGLIADMLTLSVPIVSAYAMPWGRYVKIWLAELLVFRTKG